MHILWCRDEHLFLVIVLELPIHSLLMQIFEFVAALEMTTFYLLEVPRDQILSCRGDNAGLTNAVTIVEPGRCEVNELDLILHDVLGVDGQLECLGLRFGYGLLEAGGAFVIFGRNNKEIGLAGRENPLVI